MRRSLRLTAAVTAGGLAAVAVPTVIFHSSDQAAFAAAFGSSNVVVYRVGNGSGALTNAATPVFLDEYQPGGTKVQSIALPTTSSGDQKAVTASGLSTSEGQLVRSPNGRFVTATGYAAAAGTLASGGVSLTATSPTSVPRSIAIVDGNGAVDSSTTIADSGAPHIIRSAVTTDGSRAWIGGDDGVRTAAIGSTAGSSAVSASANIDQVLVANNQLFASTSDASKLLKVGAGTPASGASLDGLPGLDPVTLPNGFVLLDINGSDYAGTGVDTLYLANGAHGGGAIEKYRYNGSAWNRVGSINLEGVIGLVASGSGNNVSIIATTPTKLYGITDNAANSDSLTASVTQLATATSNTEFRGVALAPASFNGPSLQVRSPLADAAAANIAGNLAVSVDAISSGTVSSVTAQIDSGAATPAANVGGTRWTANIPLASVGAGAHTVTISATDGSGTNTASRTFSVAGSVTPTPTPTQTPTTNPNAIQPGKASANDRKVARGKFKPVAYKKAPGKKGVKATGKATLSFTFTGSRLNLHFGADKSSGKVKVVIDGKARTINLYSKKAKDLNVLFANLGAGDHTVQVISLKKKVKKSKGFTVLLGWIQVTA